MINLICTYLCLQVQFIFCYSDIGFSSSPWYVSQSRLAKHSIQYYTYTNVSFHHAECAYWDNEKNTFHWVDVLNQNVHAIDFDKKYHRVRHIDLGEVNVAIPIKNSNRLLVAVESSLYIMDWDIPGAKGLRLLAHLDQGLPENVLNDGRADATGRLWIGSKGPQKGKQVAPDFGTLYSLEGPWFEPQVRVRPVSVSNGIVWSLDNSLMYYIDSGKRSVDVFDFNITTAHLSNRRTIIDLNGCSNCDQDVIPDGLTIDRDGLLWVALNFGGAVVRVDPIAKRIVQTIELPVKEVTCPAWGGPRMESLFVTTSRRGLKPLELQDQPLAGAIFIVNGLGTGGVPSFKFQFPGADYY